MNREIKFRKWDAENEVMIDGDSLAFEEYAPIKDLLTQQGIMQFTGRKDDKGIEIYEDDIVIDCAGRYGVVYWNPDDCQFLVDFQADGEIEEISGWHVVCGNSWENLDLLK